MKKILLLSIPIILSACGGGTSTPNSGGNTGGSTGGGTTLSYPYNPNLNGTENSDSRVPYYGEWVWAVSFSNGTSFIGRMSISKRISPITSITNAGGGAGVWCPNGDNCAYGSDIGLMGTIKSNGSNYLFGSLYENSSYQQVKFVGLDTDGVVGTEVKGAPTLSGTGIWQFYSGGSAAVGFAMAQASVNPPIKALVPAPSFSTVNRIETSQARVASLSVGVLQRNAVEALSKVF